MPAVVAQIGLSKKEVGGAGGRVLITAGLHRQHPKRMRIRLWMANPKDKFGITQEPAPKDWIGREEH